MENACIAFLPNYEAIGVTELLLTMQIKEEDLFLT